MMQLVSDIGQKIYLVRGQQVMLDNDLADFYEVPTKKLNEKVARNKKRFPSDFMFQISAIEYENLISQFAISSSTHGGRRNLPYLFTIYGATMVANVLKSKRAIDVSISVVRAFHKLREIQISELRQAADAARNGQVRQEQVQGVLQNVLNDAQSKISVIFANPNSQIEPLKSLPSPETLPQEDQKPKLPPGPNRAAEAIQRAVAKYYGIKFEDLKAADRTKAIALARQISMYLIREKLGMSFQDIAILFGRKDHTTILHACRRIEIKIAQDNQVREAVEFLKTSP